MINLQNLENAILDRKGHIVRVVGFRDENHPNRFVETIIEFDIYEGEKPGHARPILKSGHLCKWLTDILERNFVNNPEVNYVEIEIADRNVGDFEHD